MAKQPRNVLTTYVDPTLNVTVTVFKPRATPKSKMVSRTSRGYVTGTSGRANGFPRAAAGFEKK